VTRPGEWGPWVDGGGWLHVGGTAVDWLYRDLDRVRKSWEDARQAGTNSISRSGIRLECRTSCMPVRSP
jgi:hypothetical protein